jgi:CBS domain-containing protein
MSPRSFSEHALHTPEPLRARDTVEAAVRKVLEARLPALPVVGDDDRYRGIFGEREFMEALFPGYLKQLRSTSFLPRSLDEAIERRETCRVEPVEAYMNTEHVDVDPDYSDTQLAEIFLHHRVLIVPVVDGGRVVGVITRRHFFRAIAERFIGG